MIPVVIGMALSLATVVVVLAGWAVLRTLTVQRMLVEVEGRLRVVERARKPRARSQPRPELPMAAFPEPDQFRDN